MNNKWQPTTNRPQPLLVPILLLGLFIAVGPAFASRASIAYAKRWVAGIPVHVVTIDLNDPDVRLSPVLPKHGIGRSETWGALIGRSRPTAAITGTYFDTRSLHPTGDIVLDGNLICRGVVGTAVGIGWDNQVEFIPTKRGRARDWSSFQHVLVAGPLLVLNGKPHVYPRAQGFRDRGLFARRPRTAVGVTRNNKLILVAVTRPIYLRKLAKAMRALGAVQAAALDGGGSTALYYRGRTLARPGRRLTNLLVAYDCASRHQQVKHLLAPKGEQWTRSPGNATR